MKFAGCCASFASQHLSPTNSLYTLESREANSSCMPLSVDSGLGVWSGSPLAGGMLTWQASARPDAPAGFAPSCRMNERNRDYSAFVETSLHVLLWRSAGSMMWQPRQIALAWLLTRLAVSSPGCRRAHRRAVSNRTSKPSIYGSTKRPTQAPSMIVTSLALHYPYWHQQFRPPRFTEGSGAAFAYPGTATMAAR